MHSTRLSLCAAILVGTAFARPVNAAGGKANSATERIAKIEQDMTTAQNADQVVKDYDPNIVVYDMYGNSMIGRDVVRDDYAALFITIKNAKLIILSMAIEGNGKLGFAYSMQHLTATSTVNNSPIDIVFRQTDCFHYVHGKWLIINQHISVPFDGKTGLAVLNSK